MKHYIIKKNIEKNDIIKYVVGNGYSFSSKKNSIIGEIKSITIYDTEITQNTVLKKLDKEYRRLVSIICSILSSDDTEAGDVLIGFTELDRIENLFIKKYQKYIDGNILKNYLKKINILRKELYNYNSKTFNFDYYNEEKAVGR